MASFLPARHSSSPAADGQCNKTAIEDQPGKNNNTISRCPDPEFCYPTGDVAQGGGVDVAQFAEH